MAYVVENKLTGEKIAEGTTADESVVVIEDNWYFTPDNVDVDKLIKTTRTYNCPYKGVCYWYDMESENGLERNVAWVYENPSAGYEIIKNRIAFYTRETSITVPVTVRV